MELQQRIFLNPTIYFECCNTYIQNEGIIKDYGIFDNPDELFKEYDALIMPSTPDIAPLFNEASDKLSDEYLILGNHLVIGNFGGFPSISIPSGFVNNMPVSINITGRAREDYLVLNMANKIEEVLGCKGMVAKDE